MFEWILEFLWPPSTATALSIVAAIMGFWGVTTHRAIERRKTTFGHLIKQDFDRELIEARSKFIQYAQDKNGIAQWASTEKEFDPGTQYIRTVLNEYEIISIGIQKGIIDFEMYKRFHKSNTLIYWNYAAPFVFELRARTKNDALYHEFEEMVRWLKDNKMPRRYKWIGKWF